MRVKGRAFSGVTLLSGRFQDSVRNCCPADMDHRLSRRLFFLQDLPNDARKASLARRRGRSGRRESPALFNPFRTCRTPPRIESIPDAHLLSRALLGRSRACRFRSHAADQTSRCRRITGVTMSTSAVGATRSFGRVSACRCKVCGRCSLAGLDYLSDVVLLLPGWYVSGRRDHPPDTSEITIRHPLSEIPGRRTHRC